MYSLRNWRHIAGLVTAFTVGHCITLALAAFDRVQVDAGLIEQLIPITILLSCLANYVALLTSSEAPAAERQGRPRGAVLAYALILFFGLIHGLGFSNFLSAMLFDDQSIVAPLLGFNLGIEIAQLIIVFAVLAVISASERLRRKRQAQLILNTVVTVLVLQMLL